MIKLKSIFASLVLATLPLAYVSAQGLGQLQPGQMWGNATSSANRGQPTNVSAQLDKAFGSTRGSLLERGASGWAIVTPSATAGLPYVSNGTGADPAYGTITGVAFGTQSANTIFAGPTTGAAANPTFRALVGADLPNPSASTLGGVQSYASVAHQWINTISTAGVPSSSQPAFSDISGAFASAQCFIATGSNVGCVKPDGTTITVNGSGVITAVGAAATSVDGSGLTSVSNGASGGCLYENNATKVALAPCAFIPQSYGASGSAQTTTGSITAASSTLTLTAALDFVNGQGIRIDHAGAAFAVGQATGVSVVPTGATGSTTYTYYVSSLDFAGGQGAYVSAQITNGNATLSSANYNTLTFSGVGGAAGYAIYASCSPSCASLSTTPILIAIINVGSFIDQGIGGYGFAPPYVSTTAPSSSLADWLVTTISSGGGTTTLTLANAATTTATTQNVGHDDTVALQSCFTAAINAAGECKIPSGNYPTTSTLNINNGRAHIYGSGGPQGTTNWAYARQGAPIFNPTNANFYGSNLLPSMVTTGIRNYSNEASEFDHFQIIYPYPAPPSSGVTGLAITGTGGATQLLMNGTLTSGSNIITGLTAGGVNSAAVLCPIGTTNCNIGIYGSGIPNGTTVTSIDSASQIHISQNATSSITTPLGFPNYSNFTLAGTTTSSSTTVTGLPQTTTLSAGQSVTGSCVPPNDYISSITNSTTIVLAVAATSSGSCNLNFTFGIQTNASVHDMMIVQADRLLSLSNMTEFTVYNNKLFTPTSTAVFLNLAFGNGDWSYGPNNTIIGGGAYPAFTGLLYYGILEQSGGGGRITGNKFNSMGASGSTTYGYYINPSVDYTSVEPPTIVGNSLEGHTYGIAYFNSCTHPSTCSLSQGVITGNQFWEGTVVKTFGSASQWVSGLTISGNMMNVNGGGGAKNIDINSDAANWNITGNVFGNTTGTGSTAVSTTGGFSNVRTFGNMSSGGGTTLGSGTSSPGTLSCGSPLTNSFVNDVEVSFFPGSGSAITAIQKNGSNVITQASGTAPAFSTIMHPNDTLTVTCSVAPAVGYFAINP